METETKKMAPVVVEGLNGGEVQGVVEVKTVLVKYRDGHGQEATRLAVIIPGGEMYFLSDNVASKQAQSWLKTAVLRRLGLTP